MPRTSKKKSTFYGRAKKQIGTLVKKRYGTFTKPKYSQIVKDVMMLKNTINSEKKRIETNITGNLVGQVIINAAAYYSADITPIAAVGVNYNQRTGSSIKLHSSYFRFAFSQNSSTVGRVKGKIFIILMKGQPVTNPGVQGTRIWSDNGFISPSIVDYNSMRDPDQFQTYQILRTKSFTVGNDQLASQNQVVNFGLGIKYFRGKGHHIRYDANSSTVDQGQLLMYVFVDNGNISTTTVNSSSGVVTTGTNTGLVMSYTQLHYYYDN